MLMSLPGGSEAKGSELFWRGAPFRRRGLCFFDALFNRSCNFDDDQRALSRQVRWGGRYCLALLVPVGLPFTVQFGRPGAREQPVRQRGRPAVQVRTSAVQSGGVQSGRGHEAPGDGARAYVVLQGAAVEPASAGTGQRGRRPYPGDEGPGQRPSSGVERRQPGHQADRRSHKRMQTLLVWLLPGQGTRPPWARLNAIWFWTS